MRDTYRLCSFAGGVLGSLFGDDADTPELVARLRRPVGEEHAVVRVVWRAGRDGTLAVDRISIVAILPPAD